MEWKPADDPDAIITDELEARGLSRYNPRYKTTENPRIIQIRSAGSNTLRGIARLVREVFSSEIHHIVHVGKGGSRQRPKKISYWYCALASPGGVCSVGLPGESKLFASPRKSSKEPGGAPPSSRLRSTSKAI